MLEEIKKVLSGIRRDTKKLLEDTLKSYLQIARYDVTTAPNGSVIGVTRPFSDTEIFVPYLPYCANAAVGSTVLVVWWGSLTNAQAWFKLPADPGILNFRPGGLGAAFGKAAETDDLLDVAWRMKVRGTLTVGDDEVAVLPLHITIASFSSFPQTVSNADITADMRVVECTFGTPSAITSDVTWTTSAGSLVLSGSISGSTTADIILMRTT